MNERDVRKQAFAMPLTSPAYQSGRTDFATAST
jgi:acetoacetate decarboxylase